MTSLKVSTNKEKGFTMIEVLVVIGILGLVFGIGAVVNINFFTRELSRAEQMDLLAVLEIARSRSMNNIDAKPHGVYFGNDVEEFIIFKGTSYDPSDTDNEKIPRNSNIEAAADFEEVYFEQLSGNCKIDTDDCDGDIITQTDSGTGNTKTITLEANGLIDW